MCDIITNVLVAGALVSLFLAAVFTLAWVFSDDFNMPWR